MASNSFLDQNKSRIEGIAKANGVDMGVAKDMFISNITRRHKLCRWWSR